MAPNPNPSEKTQTPAPAKTPAGPLKGSVEYTKVVPAWVGSLVFHGAILALMGAMTWRIERQPDLETAVEVVMSKEEKGRLEYLDRRQLELQETASGGSIISETVEKSSLNELQEMVRQREETLNVIGVDMGGAVSSSEFASFGVTQYAGAGPSASFGEEIAKLQRVGMNVVFVFDSTGSMDRVIRQTQEHIDLLMEIVFGLVPKAKIGLVTYRDRGEEYVTKQLPLTNNRKQIRDWLFKVKADGGGDEPEAVDQALDVAFDKMPWERRAKRVVLLFGDAPPHDHTLGNILRATKQFHEKKGGIVNTIVTDAGGPATAPFEQIAESSGGESFPMGNYKEIAKKLLVLAFGSRWEKHVTDEFKKKLGKE